MLRRSGRTSHREVAAPPTSNWRRHTCAELAASRSVDDGTRWLWSERLGPTGFGSDWLWTNMSRLLFGAVSVFILLPLKRNLFPENGKQVEEVVARLHIRKGESSKSRVLRCCWTCHFLFLGIWSDPLWFSLCSVCVSSGGLSRLSDRRLRSGVKFLVGLQNLLLKLLLPVGELLSGWPLGSINNRQINLEQTNNGARARIISMSAFLLRQTPF